jgi:hypothetical protein
MSLEIVPPRRHECKPTHLKVYTVLYGIRHGMDNRIEYGIQRTKSTSYLHYGFFRYDNLVILANERLVGPPDSCQSLPENKKIVFSLGSKYRLKSHVYSKFLPKNVNLSIEHP